jgi:hypothetical protein
MTLSEFIDKSKASKEENNFKVEIILRNNQPIVLKVIDCDNEFDAKERVFLFLKELIENKNK